MRLAFVLLSVVLLAATVDVPEAVSRSKELTAAERGHLIAQQRCASCHAVEPGAERPRPRAPGFATREMRHTAGLEGRLDQLTRKGHYDMPPMSLQPSEVSDLLAYIDSLGGR